MKGFALVLLCALVAVQARYTDVQKSTSALAKLGENPWVVHLRIAVATSGLLNTCTGTLIGERWVLTSSSCLEEVRFIWVRYGAVNVINPSLVTENSLVRLDPASGLGLININRNVETTENIAPVTLSKNVEIGSSAKYCAYGYAETGKPGEQLSCTDVDVEVLEDGSIVVDVDIVTTEFDLGASLVSDGVQIAVLTAPRRFTPVGPSLDWIEAETGLYFDPEAEAPEAVHIVN